jgi:hypothetical protein
LSEDAGRTRKKYDGQFHIDFEAIRHLIEVEGKPKRKIGFIAKESRAKYRATDR